MNFYSNFNCTKYRFSVDSLLKLLAFQKGITRAATAATRQRPQQRTNEQTTLGL